MIKYPTIFFLVTISVSFTIPNLFKTHQNAPPYARHRSVHLMDFAAITHCSSHQITSWSCALCKKHTDI